MYADYLSLFFSFLFFFSLYEDYLWRLSTTAFYGGCFYGIASGASSGSISGVSSGGCLRGVSLGSDSGEYLREIFSIAKNFGLTFFFFFFFLGGLVSC